METSAGEPVISMRPFAVTKCSAWLVSKESPRLSGSLPSCTKAATRGSVRSTRGLGPRMTARGQSIGISIGMLPQTLNMLITVQKTSKYYTTEFDLE